MKFWSYTLVPIAIPFLLGYPIAGKLKIGLGASRIVYGLLIGLASLIVIIRSLQSLFPIDRFAIVLAAFCIVTICTMWAQASTVKRLRQDLHCLGWPGTLVAVACLFGAVVVLNLPLLLHHAIAFEGTANQDSFYYTLVARYMQSHSFYEQVRYSPTQPLYSFMPSVFGNGAPLGRVGAEGYLAWISRLFRRDPVYLYNPLSTAGVLVAGLASGLLFDTDIQRRLREHGLQGILVIIVLLAPALYKTSFNSNYSTIFGVAIFAGYLAITCGRVTIRHQIVGGLFLIALLATYSELVPIAWVCIAVVLLARWLARRTTMSRALLVGSKLVASNLCAMAVLPWITLAGWFVIRHSYLVPYSVAAQRVDPYAGLDSFHYVMAFVTTSREAAAALAEPFAIALTILFCILTTLGIVRALSRGYVLAGTSVVFICIMAFIFWSEYNYGKLKIVEYCALLFAATLVSGATSIWEILRPRWLSMITSTVAFACVATWFAVALSYIVNDSVQFGASKKITPNIVKLSKAIRDLPSGSLVTFGSMPSSYYYSMWLPYLSKATFLYDAAYGSGGYLGPYVAKHPVSPITYATYIVERVPLSIGAPYPVDVLAHYGPWQLLDLSHSNSMYVNGLYGVDGARSWMGGALNILVRHSDAQSKYLNIFFSERFAPIDSSGFLRIEVDDKRCEHEIRNNGDGITIRLADATVQRIRLVPTRGPESPAELGISIDARPLSYMVTKMNFSDRPEYRLVSCSL